MLFGRVSRYIILAHPKTKSNISSYQTRLEQISLASMVRWNWKKSFLAATPPDEFSTNRDKRKYPMSTLKYTAGSLMLGACFFCWRSWTSCSEAWHHGLYKNQQIKKSKPDCLCYKSYNVPSLDLPSGQQSQKNIQINTEMGHWAQN